MQIFYLIYMMKKIFQHKNSYSDVLASCCWFSCSLQYQIDISDVYFSWMTAYVIFLSDCFSFSLSIFILSYSSCSVSWNCDRICNFMNHFVRCWVFADISVRIWIFSWFVTEFFSMCLISANLKQWMIMWVTVSCAWSHWHMSDL